MFKRLVSQLSLSPAAAQQLTFYSRRLKQESVTRTFSAIAAVLVVGLQFLTVSVPSTASHAASSNGASANDLIYGGLDANHPLSDFLSIYNSNTATGSNYRKLADYYGITLADFKQMTLTTINSRKTDNGDLRSIGHISYGFSDEKKLPVPGTSSDFYIRYLKDFDTGSNKINGSSYPALAGDHNGKKFYVMLACGNLVVTFTPPPPPPPPKTISCTSLTGSPTSGKIPLAVSFTGKAAVENETVSSYIFTFGDGSATSQTTANVKHTYTKVGTYTATVQMKGSAGTTTPVSKPCSLTITTSTTPPSTSSLSCTDLSGSPLSGNIPLTVAFTGQGSAQNETIKSYTFNFGDNAKTTQAGATVSHTYTTAGNYTATLQITGSKGTTTAVSAPCSVTITAGTTPPPPPPPPTTPNSPAFVPHKSVLDITSGTVPTPSQPAAPNDLIRYSLTVENTGDGDGSYTVSDDLTDVLQYSKVVDYDGGQLSPGADAGTTDITWPAQDIPAGVTVTKTFTVQVLDPIPATPVGSSDPGSFNLTMTNVFGDTINVPVQPPVAKQVEMASANLPDTGAGSTTFMIIVFAAIVIYFYSRNRQLLAEVKILRNDYHGGPQA